MTEGSSSLEFTYPEKNVDSIYSLNSIPFDQNDKAGIALEDKELAKQREKIQDQIRITTDKLAATKSQFQAVDSQAQLPTSDNLKPIYEALADRLLQGKDYYVQKSPEGVTWEIIVRETPDIHVIYLPDEIRTIDSLIADGTDVLQLKPEEIVTYATNLHELDDLQKEEKVLQSKNPEIQKTGEKIEAKFENLVSQIPTSLSTNELKSRLEKLGEFMSEISDHKFWGRTQADKDEIDFITTKKALMEKFRSINQTLVDRNSPDFNLRQISLDYFRSHEKILLGAFAGLARNNRVDLNVPLESSEKIVRHIYALTPSEVLQIKEANSQEMRVVFQEFSQRDVKELTLEDILRMHKISSNNLMFSDEFGIRTVGVSLGRGAAVPAAECITAMNQLLDKSNDLVRRHPAKGDFNSELADRLIDYVQIHPHLDGNGKMAIYFAHALKTLYGYPIPDEFNHDEYGRLVQVFDSQKLFIDKVADAVTAFSDGKTGYKTTPQSISTP